MKKHVVGKAFVTIARQPSAVSKSSARFTTVNPQAQISNRHPLSSTDDAGRDDSHRSKT